MTILAGFQQTALRRTSESLFLLMVLSRLCSVFFTIHGRSSYLPLFLSSVSNLMSVIALNEPFNASCNRASDEVYHPSSKLFFQVKKKKNRCIFLLYSLNFGTRAYTCFIHLHHNNNRVHTINISKREGIFASVVDLENTDRSFLLIACVFHHSICRTAKCKYISIL